MPKKPEQGTFDVITPESLDRIAKESHQEKKHHHFGRHGWKGGATPKDELRLPQLDLADDGPESHGYELDPERAESRAVRRQQRMQLPRPRPKQRPGLRLQSSKQQHGASRSPKRSSVTPVLSMNDEDLISTRHLVRRNGCLRARPCRHQGLPRCPQAGYPRRPS
jgi:hypothetical protein